MRNYILIFLFVLSCGFIAEADETIRVVVTRDNWVSSFGDEENGLQEKRLEQGEFSVVA